MRIAPLLGPWLVGPLAVLVLLPLSGCGTDDYHARMVASIDRLRAFEPFQKLLHADSQRVRAKGVSVRLPRVFVHNKESFDTTPDALTGLMRGEFLFGYVQDAIAPNHSVTGKYLVAASLEPPAGGNAEQFLTDLPKRVKLVLPGALDAVVDVQIPDVKNPANTIAAKYYAASAQLPLQPNAQPVDVQAAVYFIPQGDQLLALWWFADLKSANENNFWEAARYAVGTMEYTPETPPMAEGDPAAPTGDGGAPMPMPTPMGG